LSNMWGKKRKVGGPFGQKETGCLKATLKKKKKTEEGIKRMKYLRESKKEMHTSVNKSVIKKSDECDIRVGWIKKEGGV